MNGIPKKLTSFIPAKELLKVENWWNKLSEENQLELQSIYNQDELTIGEELISIQFCGKFVEQEKPYAHDVFWINHFYEYLVNHEMIIDGTKRHIGGIVCHAYKEAELAIRNGVIPFNYQCPTNNPKCLMKKLLSLDEHSSSLFLYVKFSLKKPKEHF